MPVRAIPDYQKIIVEEGQCLQLDPRLLRGQFVFLGPAPLNRDSEIKSYKWEKQGNAVEVSTRRDHPARCGGHRSYTTHTEFSAAAQ